MDPLLAIGQIVVSIALIIAILLRARGVGLCRYVRWRFRRLPQPAWCRAPALATPRSSCSFCFVVFALAAFIIATPSSTA